MTSTTLSAPALWQPPAAVRVRGTLAVVAGAGESADVYARFGARLAADGYAVGVFAADEAPDARAWLEAEEASPRVLVGSDRGAAAVLALAAEAAAAAADIEGAVAIDGIVVAGLPVGGSDDADAAASARTACPVHLGVLATPGARRATPASAPAPVAIPDAAALAALTVPVLAIHGGADPIAPFETARAVLGAIREVELVETVGGLHDALNDQSHRSVAARVVLWLERLRAQGVDAPIVRAVTR